MPGVARSSVAGMVASSSWHRAALAVAGLGRALTPELRAFMAVEWIELVGLRARMREQREISSTRWWVRL